MHVCMHSNTATYITMCVYVCVCVCSYTSITLKKIFWILCVPDQQGSGDIQSPSSIVWPRSLFLFGSSDQPQRPGPQLQYSLLPIHPSLHSSLLCPGCFLIQIIGNQLKCIFEPWVWRLFTFSATRKNGYITFKLNHHMVTKGIKKQNCNVF